MHLPYHGAGIIFWTISETGEVSFLMGKRSMPPQNHKWSFPGGTWERARDGHDTKGKISYKETAIRECQEEVGLDVPSPEKLFPPGLLICQVFTTESIHTVSINR
ncbi:MAG: NUDIX hydrolase [Sphaerochaetaceae bacterium]|nr:NUDIX hydrolase [Sphaerochaetaceae bacterium]